MALKKPRCVIRSFWWKYVSVCMSKVGGKWWCSYVGSNKLQRILAKKYKQKHHVSVSICLIGFKRAWRGVWVRGAVRHLPTAALTPHPGAGSVGSSQLTAGVPSWSHLQPKEAAVPRVSLGATKDRWGPNSCPFSLLGSSRAPSGQACFLASLMRVCPSEPSAHITYWGL